MAETVENNEQIAKKLKIFQITTGVLAAVLVVLATVVVVPELRESLFGAFASMV